MAVVTKFLTNSEGKLLVDSTTRKPLSLTIDVASGGVSWNVSSAESLPETAEYLDICLVPVNANATTIDTSDLTVVRLANNLVANDGNIFPENTIMLFSKLDGVEGTSQISIDRDGQNLRVLDYPLAASVVNLGDMQQKVDVYIYNGKEWVKAPYMQLPTVSTETLSLSSWLGIGAIAVTDLWQELGLTENADAVEPEVETPQETLTLSVWLGEGTYTVTDLWQELGLTEEATYQLGEMSEPVPIT